MTTVPIGVGAYKRTFPGEPEIRLENRFVEKDPSNLKSGATLVGRPGAASLAQFAGGIIRGSYSKSGLFNGDLFVVSGANLYRYTSAGVKTQITGTIAGTGNPYVTWMKGIGYEILFIADGTLLQYFSEHAVGTLTLAGGNLTSQIIKIGTVYYSWSATVDTGTPAGTVGSPWLAKLGSGGVNAAEDNATSLSNMAYLINFSGISGVDYSSLLPGRSATVTATSTATTLVVTAIVNTTGGNAIASTVQSGSFLSWGAATLAGGAGTALHTVTMPDSSEVAKALTTVSSYILVSVGGSQKCYFILPGETTISALNFFEKESNPDVILDMLTVGDQAIICGDGSTETWYATGDLTAPFLPVKGRVYQRGIVEGTPVVVKDNVILVGNDGVVYSIGFQYGGSGEWGVHRISNHGIEERVRAQLRREQGLS